MRTRAVLFSGGLDSVALVILLKRERFLVDLVYMSHRHGGNVVKKEVVASGRAARKLSCDLTIVKKRPATRGSDDWYRKHGEVIHSRRLSVSKASKGRRNRTFLKVARGDVCHELLVKSTPWLEPGQLVTFESLEVANKTQMLKAVGRRSKKNCELLWASESCLMYFNKPCGNCISCVERGGAFTQAWGQDKTPYRKGTTADKIKRKRARA